MKKILVTGAAGAIGLHVIKYLLTEGKYEITAIDLKNKYVYNRLKRFKKRINILYGDVCDRVLMEALVKEQDVVIHLASSLPPLADMKKGLANIIDYKGTENIVRAINYYNPNCHLFFSSSTTVYKDKEDVTVKTKIGLDEYDYFSQAKIDAENLIKSKLKNYTIYRLPLILSNPKDEAFMYHCPKTMIEAVTKEDAALSFVRGINYIKELNRKTYNVTGENPINYKELLNKMLEIYGLSWKYVLSKLFLEKDYYSPICKDRDELNNIIDYRHDTLSEYYNRLRSRAKKRNINRMLAKPFIKGENK